MKTMMGSLARCTHTGSRLFLYVALATGLAIPALHAQTVWYGPNGDWFAGGNWSGGVPDSGDTATVAGGAGVVSITTAGAVADRLMIDGAGVTVDGAGTLTVINNSGADALVLNGPGSALVVSGGAQVNNTTLRVAQYTAGQTSSVTVSGAGSSLINTADTTIGGAGNGLLHINNGGSVTVGTSGTILTWVGNAAGSHGAINVTGAGSSFHSAYAIVLGASGTGEMTIADGAAVTVNSVKTVVIGNGVGSSGRLTIGAGGAAGTLNADYVSFRLGTTKELVFNHNETSYAFGTAVTSTAAGGKIIQQGTGKTVLTAAGNNFDGTVQIDAGTLAITGDLMNAVVSVNAGGTFSPGDLSVESRTIEGLSLDGGAVRFDLGAGLTSDLVAIGSGTAALNASTQFFFADAGYDTDGIYTLLSGAGVAGFDTGLLSYDSDIAGLTGAFSIVGNDLVFTATVVPEPGSSLLMIAGLLGLGLVRRRARAGILT